MFEVPKAPSSQTAIIWASFLVNVLLGQVALTLIYNTCYCLRCWNNLQKCLHLASVTRCISHSNCSISSCHSASNQILCQGFSPISEMVLSYHAVCSLVGAGKSRFDWASAGLADSLKAKWCGSWFDDATTSQIERARSCRAVVLNQIHSQVLCGWTVRAGQSC